MLSELCHEINNYFPRKKYFDTYTIEDGILVIPELQSGQYYRIVGSVFNDGVHKYGDAEDVLTDETFDGSIWAMAIPEEVIALSEEIDEWKAKYETAETMSPYQSESFGGYSYTKASGASGGTATWQDVFGSRLNNYRRIKPF